MISDSVLCLAMEVPRDAQIVLHSDMGCDLIGWTENGKG